MRYKIVGSVHVTQYYEINQKKKKKKKLRFYIIVSTDRKKCKFGSKILI